MLPIEESFDVLQRDIEIGGRASSFYFIDGFMKDEAMVKIMASFFAVTEKNMPDSARAFSEKVVSYVEVDIINDFDDIIRNILSGVTCLLLTAMKNVLPSTHAPIRQEEWMNLTRTNLSGDQEMGL